MSALRLLDLFCGAGGAGKGYIDAGFDVTGIARFIGGQLMTHLESVCAISELKAEAAA